MFILLLLLITTPVYAFTADNTIKRQPIQYVRQYHGQKDRYNEALLRNDPEVLVANSHKELSVKVYDSVSNDPKDAVIIKTCWDMGSGCEPQ